jgi:hypothetical protein
MQAELHAAVADAQQAHAEAAQTAAALGALGATARPVPRRSAWSLHRAKPRTLNRSAPDVWRNFSLGWLSATLPSMRWLRPALVGGRLASATGG